MHATCTPALSNQTTPLSARERESEVKEEEEFAASAGKGSSLKSAKSRVWHWWNYKSHGAVRQGVRFALWECVCVSRGVEVDRYFSQSGRRGEKEGNGS